MKTLQDHPAQAAVNAIMADENVSPDFRRALALGQVVVADGGRLTVDRYPHALLCGCVSDGSHACDEHLPRGRR